jgi:hypothetical protein
MHSIDEVASEAKAVDVSGPLELVSPTQPYLKQIRGHT